MKEEKEENQMKKRAEEEEEDILEEEIIEIDLRGYQELSQLLKGEQRHQDWREKIVAQFSFNVGIPVDQAVSGRLEYLDQEKRVKKEYVLKEKEGEGKKGYWRIEGEGVRREGEGRRVLRVSGKYRREAELKREVKKRKKRMDISVRNEIKREERDYLQEIMKKQEKQERRA